jgi:hypothetical protein
MTKIKIKMSINIPDNAPRRILDLDESIRFVAFTDRFGTKMISEQRKGLEPLLTEDELKQQATVSAQMMNTIKGLRPKLGSPICSSTLYEKVKWATILLDNTKEYDLLMLSFDIGLDHESVILNKILPMVKKGW